MTPFLGSNKYRAIARLSLGTPRAKATPPKASLDPASRVWTCIRIQVAVIGRGLKPLNWYKANLYLGLHI